MRKTLIIAEAGVNHNGDINLAFKLIDEAKKCGADIVKFQTAVPKLVMTNSADKADYQKMITGDNESQIDMANRIHLPLEAFKQLNDYCKKKEIQFLSSPFDLVSIDVLEELKMPIYKIPSGEITNYPFLRKIGRLGKKVIMSTGMAKLGEIEAAIEVFISEGMGKKDIIVLHCNTEYPTPFEDVNLNAMLTIKEAFKVNVGYSDHTLGIDVPIAAVALGATVIEKHFTLDRTMEGPDHKASLEPDELEAMVKSIRNIERALGNGIKQPSASEKKNIPIARKSIHLAKSLTKNHILTENDLIMKRPGDGISPMLMERVIGKKLNCDLDIEHKLEWGNIGYH